MDIQSSPNRSLLVNEKLSVASLVVGYALCSSLLAIINKLAISVFPYPALLTSLQYLTCVVSVYLLGWLKLLEHDHLKLSTIRKFFPAAIIFYLAIFTNTNLLKYANVDTFIVFRSSTPILVAVADTVVRKQPWPTQYTFASLILILLGAVGYVTTDSQYNVRAYSWAFAYLTVITIEMVYVKHIVSSLGLNTWGYVLYNNAISLALGPIFWIFTGEYVELKGVHFSSWGNSNIWLPVLFSCGFGLAISFFGFACRRAISATSFTVVGVTNKLLTVVINVVMWEKHASVPGIGCLLLTIFGGVAYQQTASGHKRETEATSQVAVRDEEYAGKTNSTGALDSDSDGDRIKRK